MITRSPRSVLTRWFVMGLPVALSATGFLLLADAAQKSEAAPEATAAPAAPIPPAPAPADAKGADYLSPAQECFQKGVDLYSKNLFREALNEFNRALTLDANFADAIDYRDKCLGKLQMSAAGQDPAKTPKFESVDPNSLAPGAEAPRQSAEELKRQRVRELLELGQKYLENKKYSRAVEYFDQVLLIAPDNRRAKDMLHDARIGAYKEDITRSEKKTDENRAEIIKDIESTKQLPADADSKGLKPYKMRVEVSEEAKPEEVEQTDMDKMLDTKVSVEMKDVHISDVTDFFASSFDVNIVIDSRVVQGKQAEVPTAGAVPGVGGTFQGAPGVPGQPNFTAPGVNPTASPNTFQNFQRPSTSINTNRNRRNEEDTSPNFQVANAGQSQAVVGPPQIITDGKVPYINLKEVTLRQALRALLRPMGLDFAIQPGFIWISAPERIRLESFEELETRYYELKNAGAETLPKIVVQNQGGRQGSNNGVGGNNGNSGFGGGNTGSTGGFNSGGNSSGGFNSGGTSGNSGGFNSGGTSGNSSFGNSGNSGNFGNGNTGGGGVSGGGGAQFSNISQLFTNISDTLVGEPPAVIGLSSATTGFNGGGGGGGLNAGGRGGNLNGGGGNLNGGGRGGNLNGGGNLTGETGTDVTGSLSSQVGIISILKNIIPDVIDPNTGQVLSYMDYNPILNQLIVYNTPTNLKKLEKQITHLDVTPKEVSIEAKFVTIQLGDQKKIGFKWDTTNTDINNRPREIPSLSSSTYNYDINGDGVADAIPFYTKPNGTNVINNTVTQGILTALANPGPAGAFSLTGIIKDNGDGDNLKVVFDYLNSLTETELLSAPRVTTMNRKPAVIADFLTQTFQTSATQNLQTTAGSGFSSGTTTNVTQNFSFETFIFGITLSVTPQISGVDQVRLWLNPQVTTMVGVDEFQLPGAIVNGEQQPSTTIRVPRTSVQSVWTNVIVHDGDTLVLGGLITDRTTKGEDRMPYLADIPVLGFFFRGKSKEVTQSSLLIFVTTDIIDPTGARAFAPASASKG